MREREVIIREGWGGLTASDDLLFAPNDPGCMLPDGGTTFARPDGGTVLQQR